MHDDIHVRPRRSRRQTLQCILDSIAPPVAGFLETDGTLGLCQPHLEELGVELVPAAGVRLDSDLEPIKDPSLYEHPGRRHLGLGECRIALCRSHLLLLNFAFG